MNHHIDQNSELQPLLSSPRRVENDEDGFFGVDKGAEIVGVEKCKYRQNVCASLEKLFEDFDIVEGVNVHATAATAVDATATSAAVDSRDERENQVTCSYNQIHSQLILSRAMGPQVFHFAFW